MLPKANLTECNNFIDFLLTKQDENKLEEEHLSQVQHLISQMNDIQLRRVNLFLQKKIEEDTPASSKATQIQNQIIEYMKKERSKLESFSQDIIPRRFRKLYNRSKSIGSKIPHFPPNRISATKKISAAICFENLLSIKLYKMKLSAIRSLQTFGSSHHEHKLISVVKGVHRINESIGTKRTARAHFYHWRSKSSYTVSSLAQNLSGGSLQKYLTNNELSKPFANLLYETEKPRKKAFHVINLINKLQNIFTARIQTSFLRIRVKALVYSRIRTQRIFALRNIQGMLELRITHQKLTAIRVWRTATFPMSLQMSRIHNRLKARLLISMATHLQPSLDLAQAMSRWKVIADKNIMKIAIAKFANNIKINPLTALWKLKGCLNDGERKRRRQEYLQKISRALKMLSGITGKIMKANDTWAYSNIQSYAHKKKIALKLLQKLEEGFKNAKRAALMRWRNTVDEKDLKIVRKIIGNFMHDMRKNLLLAMYRWRLCAVSMKLDYERRLQVALQKLDETAKLKTEFLRIEAFDEIARENRRQALMEHIFLRDRVETNDGVKILTILLEKRCLTLKQHGFTTLAVFGKNEQLENEKALTKLAMIAGIGLRQAFFKWKTLTARETSKLVNEFVKGIFLICQENLKTNMRMIFDTEIEFKRKAVLKYLKTFD